MNSRKTVPVLLGHCLMASSSMWIFGPKNNSLGYLLADQNFDVWLFNSRGNIYSNKHVKWKDSSSEFWNFGLHESAIFDYPATIDYILEKTNQKSLYFVGYSMGTTKFFMFMSEMPGYNAKIKMAFLLGPAAIVENANLAKLANGAELVQNLLQTIGIGNVMPDILARFSYKFCHLGHYHTILCQELFRYFVSSDPDTIDLNMVPTYLGQIPAGTSVSTFVHFGQFFRNANQFLKFDFGTQENVEKYGTITPPEYSLHKITSSLVLYFGDNDQIVKMKNIKIFTDKLNAKHEVIEKYGFNHLDFLFSTKAASVYHDIIERMITDSENKSP